MNEQLAVPTKSPVTNDNLAVSEPINVGYRKSNAHLGPVTYVPSALHTKACQVPPVPAVASLGQLGRSHQVLFRCTRQTGTLKRYIEYFETPNKYLLRGI